MSIINDAIRKNRRDNRQASQFGDDPLPPRVPSRGQDPGQLLVLLAATALIASVTVGIGVFLVLQLTDRDTPSPASAAPVATASAGAGTVRSDPPTDPGDPPAPESTRAVAEEPGAETEATEIEPIAGGEKEQVMQASVSYIQGLPISGVRISDAGRIAIIGKSVYREGEVINAALGLSLHTVRSEFLLFEDRFGNKYRRRL